jgi:ABC-2 type transport system permease protein
LLGIVLWNYFAEVTNNGVSAIVARGDLIRKLNFPKYVIVLAGSFSALINLFINLGVVLAFMLLKNVDLHMHIWMVPLVIFELFLFALSIAFLLSAVFVKLRDINYVWEVFMQGLFYATPIIYPISMLPEGAAKLFILNPIAQCAQDLRYLLVTPQTETIGSIYGSEMARLIPLGMVLAVTAFSFWFFKRNSPRFAEEV